MTRHISRSRRNRKSRCSRGRNPCFPPPFLTRLLGLEQEVQLNDLIARYLDATGIKDASVRESIESVLGLHWRPCKGQESACRAHAAQPGRSCWGSCGSRPRGGPSWLGCLGRCHPRWRGSLSLRRPSCCRGPTGVGLSCCPLGACCPIPVSCAGAYMGPAGLVHV